MKQKKYANRGQPFENFIRFANERYQQKGIAMITKQATEFIPIRNSSGKVCDVKVEHKATVDFLGRYKQYPIAIEAKNTSSDSIRFDAVQPHQADYMDAFCNEPGTIGLVLVSFNLQKFYAVPWAFWGEAYDLRVRRQNKAPVRLHAFDEEWTIPNKMSARIDEIPPQFEVFISPKYGLDYLEKAEKYITG